MFILFDHGTPAPLRSFLKNHTVKKAKDLGWDELSNGELLRVAEEAGFEILITTDKNIRYQQNLSGRKISLIVLGNAQWPILRPWAERVVIAVGAAMPGTYIELDIPTR